MTDIGGKYENLGAVRSHQHQKDKGGSCLIQKDKCSSSRMTPGGGNEQECQAKRGNAPGKTSTVEMEPRNEFVCKLPDGSVAS
ncbi:unnamed protein product [Lampetra fluviatilis]